jgi:hypothetical protein
MQLGAGVGILTCVEVPGMRRRLSIFISAVSLALCLAAVGCWVRSYATLDEWSAVDEANVLRGVLSYHGALHLIRAERNAAPRPLGWDAYEVTAGADEGDVYTTGVLEWRRLGFMTLSAPPVPQPVRVVRLDGSVAWAQPAPGPPGAAPFGLLPPGRRPLTPWLLSRPFRAWVIPYWPIVLLLGVPPGRVFFRATRAALRRRTGRCAACGYDLRASPDRCPECGVSRRAMK